ncbi:MAG TPA: DUF3822 family protein [Candidatus Cryptobacteroides excrementigallinarum]|nr:DUF3822 family protein [Candidatus Cryptobacteroides excrementigallinarum]
MFTLVPTNFFNPDKEREALAGVARLGEDCAVRHIDIPQYDAVLVYSVDGDSVVSAPEIAGILDKLPDCPAYNKILCSLRDGRLTIAIAQGKSLLLANSFAAPDFTTAEYYIFLAVKSLQINPEVSTICWLTELDSGQEMSLYRYFKSVVRM